MCLMAAHRRRHERVSDPECRAVARADWLRRSGRPLSSASLRAQMPKEELDAKVAELMVELDSFKTGSVSFRQFLSWIKRQQCAATGEKRLTDEMNNRARCVLHEPSQHARAQD
jgi:hypothetical protein